ncbi:MAG: TonB-dependent receptor [Pseudomonadota bacterium]
MLDKTKLYKTTSYKTALLGAVALSFALPAVAQEADTDTEEQDLIIVQGSRLNQTATEIGSSVSIITAEDIEELGFDFALDAVAAAPGVTINQNGPFGGSASVRIRGAASDQTLVLIDGVVVNDVSQPGGGFNFARLDTENIERIEVLNGPQSTLWGTDAVGGVISIITKRPDEGLGGSIFGEYGSFNTFRGGASIENANDTGDFRLAVVSTSSDGISKADEEDGNTEEDAYEALTLSAAGGLNLGGDVRLSGTVLWADTEADIDGFGAMGFGDTGDVAASEEISANVSLTGSLFEGRLENLLLIGYSDITRENPPADTFSLDVTGERQLYRYQGTLGLNEKNTLAFGVEREETSVDNRVNPVTSGDIYINGYFGLYEFQPNDQLTLTGGIRVDDHETFGSETTGRFAAAYNPTSSVTVRASWGQGFKAPTLFQLTGAGFAQPNPDLQPETSEALDVGVDWRSSDNRYEASISVFRNAIENQISFASTGYFNEAEVDTEGVELAGSVQLTDWAGVDVSYAYIDATDADGDQLRRVPEHSGDVRFILDPAGPLSGSVLVRHNGEERERSTVQLDSWTRVDLNASYDINEKVELFGRIENLFDENYQQIFRYGTPGLSGYLGVRLRY